MCVCLRMLFLVCIWTAYIRVIIYGKIRKIIMNGMGPAQLAYKTYECMRV